MPCVENGHDHRVVVVSTTDAAAAQGVGGHYGSFTEALGAIDMYRNKT